MMMRRFLLFLITTFLMLQIVGIPCGAASLPFTDVGEKAWYYSDVVNAFQRGLVDGVLPNRFEPEEPTTRAMLVQMLYRMAGKPNGGNDSFTDVPADAWYAEAVCWACSADIIGGYGNGTFGPEDNVTREQLTTILYRYASYYGLDTENNGTLGDYPDVKNVSRWAVPSMAWAIENGIVNGTREGKKVLLAPKSFASRAQIATLLNRFCLRLRPALSSEKRFTARGYTIAYLPLDNRPVNDQRTIYLANSVGMRLLMPEESLYATRLDTQTPNPNGLRYGDGKALLQWLLDNEKNCDAIVVSMDQLLSGGLVNSRWENDSDLSEEYAMIDTLAELAKRKPLYVFDTVMRLATTVNYQGLDSQTGRRFRAYGMQARPVLEGENLTIENICAGYPYDEKGNLIATELPEEQVKVYLNARERKLRLTDYLLRYAGQFACCYIGVDDSAPCRTIQSNELQYLQEKLGGNGYLFCAADELGLMSITRAYAALDQGASPKLFVRYFGGQEDSAAGGYDTATLREAVEQHIAALGATVSKQQEAQLQVLVLSHNCGNEEAERFLSAWHQNDRNAVPTVVIDISSKTEHLHAMLDDLPVTWLMGFSNWGTAGNAIGIALSMGLTRLQWLTGEMEQLAEDNKAFTNGLIFTFVKEIAYCRFVRPYMADMTPDAIEQALLTCPETKSVSTALSGKKLVASLGNDGVEYESIGTYRLYDFSAPFDRSYEIRFQIQLGAE